MANTTLLNSLSPLQLDTPTEGQTVAYDATAKVWKNHTVAVVPDTVSFAASSPLTLTEAPTDTFTVGLPTTATPELAGLGIGRPGVADALTFGAGGGLVTRDSGDLTLSTPAGEIFLLPDVADGYGLSVNSGASNIGALLKVVVDGGPIVALFENLDDSGSNDLVQVAFIANESPTVHLHGVLELQSSGNGDNKGWFGFGFDDSFANTDLFQFWNTGELKLWGTTRTISSDSGDLTLSTTTSGNILLQPADGLVDVTGSVSASSYTASALPSSDAGLTAGQFYQMAGAVMVKL